MLDQTIDPATGLPSQSRDVSGIRTDFLYDGLGRLTWVRPESGHGVWTQLAYDAGTGGQQTALGDRDLLFDFDAYERLIAVRDRSTPGWPLLKAWVYAASNGPNNRKLGRLESATHHNVRRIPWSPATVVSLPVKETYAYGGPGGLPSWRKVDLNNGHRTFEQSWAYDQLGNVTQRTYPRCTHSGCAPSAGRRGPLATFTSAVSWSV
ncbi:MAG: hypothetical protein HC794_07530 [Nitrospiraceae bacterium]|nr:hypothetical protein [Nitrospiraceae bacterium]